MTNGFIQNLFNNLRFLTRKNRFLKTVLIEKYFSHPPLLPSKGVLSGGSKFGDTLSSFYFLKIFSSTRKWFFNKFCPRTFCPWSLFQMYLYLLYLHRYSWKICLQVQYSWKFFWQVQYSWKNGYIWNNAPIWCMGVGKEIFFVSKGWFVQNP